MVQAAGRAAGAFAADGGDAATAGGDTHGSGKRAWPIVPGARPPVRATTQAAIAAAEAYLDNALARIGRTVGLLDALGDLAESYFEAIVASRASCASPDAVREAAYEHALLVLHLVAGESTPCFGAGASDLAADGIAGIATSRLVQGLAGPLCADEREMAAAERKAVDDVAYATYGLTQARIRLTATQQRISRASSMARCERRVIEAAAISGAGDTTFAELAEVLRTRIVAAACDDRQPLRA